MISVKRVEDVEHPKRLGITISINVDIDSPEAQKVYRALALMVRTLMTPAEQAQFLEELERERAKLANVAPGAVDTVTDTIRTRGQTGRKRKTPGRGE